MIYGLTRPSQNSPNSGKMVRDSKIEESGWGFLCRRDFERASMAQVKLLGVTSATRLIQEFPCVCAVWRYICLVLAEESASCTYFVPDKQLIPSHPLVLRCLLVASNSLLLNATRGLFVQSFQTTIRSGCTFHLVRATFPSASSVDCVWNVMAHAQKSDIVFRWKGRVHLNRQGR